MIARGKFVFSYLLGLSKKRTSRDMWSSWNYFRNNNGQRRYKERNKERYKKIKWRNTWCSFFVRTNLILEISVSSLRLSKTKDSFQGRLDSNVQSTMSRMARELIWNKLSNHRRPKPGICTISINCPFMTRCQKNSQEKSILRTDNDRDHILHFTT